MSERGPQEPGIRISITPEPTEEEAAAIVAVVTALASSLEAAPTEDGAPEADRWALAGRYEALRGPLWPVDQDWR